MFFTHELKFQIVPLLLGGIATFPLLGISGVDAEANIYGRHFLNCHLYIYCIPVNHITHTESDTHSLTPGVSGLVDPSPLQRRPSRHPSPLPAAASPLHQWSAWDLTSSKQWNLSFRFVQLFSSKVVLVLTSITAVHRSEHAFSPHRDRITNGFVFN